MENVALIDNHAHIQEELFPGQVDEVVARSREAGIVAVVNIGTSLRESEEMYQLCQKYPGYLYPTVGLHPEDARHEIEQHSLTELEKLVREQAQRPGVVAIGECGFDFGKTGIISPDEKKQQHEVFELQAQIAHDLSLPLVVHCRNAWNETFAVLAHFSKLSCVILHSFTGNADVAREAIKKGYFCSFSGIVTFKNAHDIQAAARLVPLENVLLETDSPFLAPEPNRGQQNEPKNVALVASYLTSLRRESYAEIASKTVESTKKLYKIGS